MFHIRKTFPSDILQLMQIEHSANQAFAQIPQLKWLAESAVMSSDQHLDLIQNHDAFVAVNAVNDGNCESCSFACSSLCNCQNVFALHDRRNRFKLNICRAEKAVIVEVAQ